MTDVTPPRGPSGPSDERPEAGDELTPEELACGYLDGELAPDERARVEADPALMALVAELRTVSEAVASPVAAAHRGPPGGNAGRSRRRPPCRGRRRARALPRGRRRWHRDVARLGAPPAFDPTGARPWRAAWPPRPPWASSPWS